MMSYGSVAGRQIANRHVCGRIPILVASSTSNHDAANGAENVSRRISFAKINEPLKVPNLLAIQTDSFDRLVGNERWAERLEKAQGCW